MDNQHIKNMFYLALDTSSTFGIVALYNNQKIICFKSIPSTELSAKLMPSIEELFLENNLTIQSISFIAVGIGPGSFTGTRIGVVSTKAIAYTLNLPIVEFCSLVSFIPLNAPNRFSILSDAKSGQLYQLDIIKNDDNNIKISNPIIKKSSDINFIESPLFSYDSSVLKINPIIQSTNFNLELLGSIIIKEYSKKNLTNAFNLKPIYLKNP